MIIDDNSWLYEVIDKIYHSDFAEDSFAENVFFSVPCIFKLNDKCAVIIAFSNYDAPLPDVYQQKLYKPFASCKVTFPSHLLNFDLFSKETMKKEGAEKSINLLNMEKKLEEVSLKESLPKIDTFSEYYTYINNLEWKQLYDRLSILISNNWLTNDEDLEFQKEIAKEIAPYFYKVPDSLVEFYNTWADTLLVWILKRI